MRKHFKEIVSTSAYLKANIDKYRHGDVISTDFQSAGYGQKGNHWESEKEANALFSIKMEPVRIAPTNGFMLTEIVTLGILDALNHEKIMIKWPNDIYINDHKLAGILIEATMSATSFMAAVIGIGLNLNQTHFLSDAPNPISMRQITGKRYNTSETIEQVCTAILERYEKHADEERYDNLHKEYLSHLYRFEEWHKYQLPTGKVFEARIVDVNRNGLLVLEENNGHKSSYEFKTIKYLL